MKWKHRRGDPSAYQALAAIRSDLLDLGLGNPLLNYTEQKSRGIPSLMTSPVQIVSHLIERNGHCAFGSQQLSAGDMIMPSSRELELGLLGMGNEQSDSPFSAVPTMWIHTGLTELELNQRLGATYYSSKASLEEEGCVTLYVCLGLLKWKSNEDQNGFHSAPLLLVPVQLDRSSVSTEFRLSYSGNGILSNDCLLEQMKSFGIEVPTFPEAGQSDVLTYFKAMQSAILHQPSWYVDVDTVSLGVFSLSRLSIYWDLNPDLWPNNALLDHDIIRILLQGGAFSSTDIDKKNEQPFDELRTTRVGTQVVDADSSQLEAILEVSRGKSLVIQGPPGTGKSQTIVNIIADAVASGKRVLFVSEKVAALEVVKRRLDDVGLGETVLALHSDRTQRKDVFAQLRRTLDLRGSAAAPDLNKQQLTLEALRAAQKRLNDYCSAINMRSEPSGESAYAIYGKIQSFADALDLSSLPPLEMQEALEWTPSNVQLRHQAIDLIQSALRSSAVPRLNPFWGASAMILTPSLREKVRGSLQTTRAAMEKLLHTRAALESALGAPMSKTWQELSALEIYALALHRAPDISGLSLDSPLWFAQTRQVQDALSAGEEVSALQKNMASVIRADAWVKDVSGLQEAIRNAEKGWWKPTSGQLGLYQQEVAKLVHGLPPHDMAGVVSVLDTINRHQTLCRRLETQTSVMQQLFGIHWKGLGSDWSLLRQQYDWFFATISLLQNGSFPPWMVARVQSHVDKAAVNKLIMVLNNDMRAFLANQESVKALLGIPEDVPDLSIVAEAGDHLDRLEDVYSILTSRVHELDTLARYLRVRADVLPVVGAELIHIADTWQGASKNLLNLFEYHRLSSVLQNIFAGKSSLLSFDSKQHSKAVDEFRALDIASMESARSLIAASHIARISSDTVHRDKFERLMSISVVRSSLPPIRKVMAEVSDAIQVVKPVFMMSPNSVASFLPPDSVRFDLVVFDEASQLRPAEALGAIARGTQTIVAGDSKQLPPSRFLETQHSYDLGTDSQSLSDVESILGLFCSRNAPQQMLRWHYRSKHESLVALSNHLFYDDRMIVFPSPDRRRIGAGLTCFPIHVEGGVSDDAAREAEAKAIAVYVIDHITEQAALPHRDRSSIGVATLNAGQRDRILHQLDLLRYSRPELEVYFSNDQHEPFFVKTLETVQGDERDLILISVGYGQPLSKAGLRALGPLIREGGERRLNVLFTRARRRCEVFTTILSSGIELSEDSPAGLSAFKRFLNYAEFGRINRAPAPDSTASAFEAQVAQVVEQFGYTVQRKVGLAGFYLDLAIVDPKVPERYLMGILCDGPSYADARSSRDRDRLREQALLDIGWNLYRVWSTAWYLDREHEINKITAALASSAARWSEAEPTTGHVYPSIKPTNPGRLQEMPLA